jgi:hypothetical protein
MFSPFFFGLLPVLMLPILMGVAAGLVLFVYAWNTGLSAN